MMNNMNASAVAVTAAQENNLANDNTTPNPRTTPPTPAKDIQIPSSLDMMALAYCIAEEKDMDLKVVHDLLVTAADILQKGDAADIWERVKQLTRGGDADESALGAKKHRATQKRSSTAIPADPSNPDSLASTSSASFDDAEETEEEAYELGYQNGLQDGESGFGRIHRRWQGRGKERNGLASAYKAGYDLGYATGRDSVKRKTRDKRTDAESYYNGYDVEDDLYRNYD